MKCLDDVSAVSPAHLGKPACRTSRAEAVMYIANPIGVKYETSLAGAPRHRKASGGTASPPSPSRRHCKTTRRTKSLRRLNSQRERAKWGDSVVALGMLGPGHGSHSGPLRGFIVMTYKHVGRFQFQFHFAPSVKLQRKYLNTTRIIKIFSVIHFFFL